jgi:hypothetical protein
MTREEVLAKAAEWEAAGQPDKAAKLRAYAETLAPAAPVHDRATVEAKAAEWEAAGQPEKAEKLRAYGRTLQPVAEVASDPENLNEALGIAGRVADPVAGSPEDLDMRADEIAVFEAANPKLKGKYKPGDTLPKPGAKVGLGKRQTTTVAPWRERDIKRAEDTFGETAMAMMEGPVEGMKSFAGGITGANPSPSREFLANDPLTQGLPGPLLTGMGAVGDLGGAALSGVGAGLSGLIGLGTELVPGQTAQGERKLADDLLGMASVAVPELAGVSSVPARVAAASSKVPPAVPAVPKVADDVAAAERLGIPVMRTDVSPPSTFVGKVAQKTGESIPLAGTGGMRAGQNSKRVQAAQNFVREYGADGTASAIDDVAAGLLEKRGADLKKFTQQKREVIEGLSDKGVVPTPKAIAAIDDQIAKLKKQNMSSLDPVIAKLEEFKTAIRDQKLTEIEANRAVIGEAFSGLDMGAIRGAGEKALSAVYGPLRDDMAAFIKSVGGQTALNKWGSANAKLSDMAGELGNSALKRALSKGEASPETVRTLLFSGKPSDVKLLYQNLNDTGRASARTAIVQEALAKAGGLENLSPDRFKTALSKLGNQVGVFFKGDDLDAATGLVRALKLTERGAVAGAAPLTGIQTLPALMGLGLGGTLGLAPAALTGGGIGMVARIYEATGVKRALRQMAKAKGPKEDAAALQTLSKALEDAGIPTGNAAAQAANANAKPDYEALWGRY